MTNPQDQQFEQTQKIIKHLEEMKSHEYIHVDPIFKSNLKRNLIGAPEPAFATPTTSASPSATDFSSATSQSTATSQAPADFSSPPTPPAPESAHPITDAIDVTPSFQETLKEKFSFLFKLAPALLVVFVVFFSIKNVYFDTPVTTEENTSEESTEESKIVTTDNSATEMSKSTSNTQETPTIESIAVNPEINIEDTLDSKISSLVNKTKFLEIPASIQGEIQEQIITKLTRYPYEISAIQFELSPPSPESKGPNLMMRLALTSGEKYLVWFSKDKGIWKAVAGEQD